MIFRLSNELLSEVFSYLIPDCETIWTNVIRDRGSHYELMNAEEPREPCPDLLNILRVCRRWRATALSCGILWRDLHVAEDDEDLFLFMLHFAKKSPLYVPPPLTVDCFDNIFKHLYHTQELEISIPEDDHRLIDSLFDPNAAPILESLWIQGHSSRPDCWRAITITAFPPLLSWFSLDRVHISAAPGLRPSALTVLHAVYLAPLCKCFEENGFFDVLTKMPNLTELKLCWEPYIPRVKPKILQVVHLPQLQFFEFSGTPAHYAIVAPALSVPDFTKRTIALFDWSDFHPYDDPPVMGSEPGTSASEELQERYLHDFHDELAKAFRKRQEASNGQTSAWQVHFELVEGGTRDQDFSLNIKVTSKPLDPDADSETVLCIKFAYESVDIFTGALPFISSISDLFPPNTVGDLHFTSDLCLENSRTYPEWTPSFLEWTEVKSLHIGGACVAAWFAPHLQLQKGEGRLSLEMSIFPGLEKLVLDKVGDYFSELATPDLGSMREELEAVIQLRAESSQKLKVLEISECGFRGLEAWVNKIKMEDWVEDELVWDEVVPDDEDEDEDDEVEHMRGFYY